MGDLLREGCFRLSGVALIVDPAQNLDFPGVAAVSKKGRGFLLAHLDDAVIWDGQAAKRAPAVPEQLQPEPACHDLYELQRNERSGDETVLSACGCRKPRFD